MLCTASVATAENAASMEAVSCHVEVQLGPVWEVEKGTWASSVNMVRVLKNPCSQVFTPRMSC